ncbi:hypothetical protein JCM10213v2_007342 [Rhodosporidiobolus nylandii]
MLVDNPARYEAACFTKEGGQLEMQRMKWVEPQENEVVLRVLATGLNANDYSSAYRLIGDMPHFPLTPGQVCVGKVAAVGGNSRFKLEEVCGAVMRGGALAEYVVVREDALVPLDLNGLKPEEAVIPLFQGAKLFASFRNNTYGENDLVVVHGQGGFARLAIDLYKRGLGHQNLVLITHDLNAKAEDYGLDKDEMLVVGTDNIAKKLREKGRARAVVCVDAPEHSMQEVIQGMLDDARFVLQIPSQKELRVPTAEFVWRGLSLCGSPYASPKVTQDALALFRDKALAIRIKPFKFTETGVRDAWRHLSKGDAWDAPVVVFKEGERQ